MGLSRHSPRGGLGRVRMTGARGVAWTPPWRPMRVCGAVDGGINGGASVDGASNVALVWVGACLFARCPGRRAVMPRRQQPTERRPLPSGKRQVVRTWERAVGAKRHAQSGAQDEWPMGDAGGGLSGAVRPRNHRGAVRWSRDGRGLVKR
jgi:hypothetical protein